MGCDIMDFDSIRLNLETIKEKIDTLKNAIKIDEKRERIKKLEAETMTEGFWEDNEKSSKVLTQMKNLKSEISKYENLEDNYNDALTFLELAIE